MSSSYDERIYGNMCFLKLNINVKQLMNQQKAKMISVASERLN